MFDENIKAFLVYGKGTMVETRQLSSDILLILLFGGPVFLFTNLFLKIILVITVLAYLIIIIYCRKNKKDKHIIFLYWGVMEFTFCLIFYIGAVSLLLFIVTDDKKSMAIIGMMTVYVLFGFLYLLFIKNLIKKGAYKEG